MEVRKVYYESPGAALGAAWALIVCAAAIIYLAAYGSILKTMSAENLVVNTIIYITVVFYIMYKVSKKFMTDAENNVA